MANLLFAIPAFNEEATIGRIVRALLPSGRVLVVDDGSHDRTVEEARSAGATVLQHVVNSGYDSAIATALETGRRSPCDWIITIDADGQHEAADIVRFETHFAYTDLILGTRPRRSMRIGERLLGLYYRCKYQVHDPLTGFKAYRREMLARISVPQATTAHSYGLDALDAVLQVSPRIAEVPITIRKRADNARIGSKWRVNQRMFKCLIKRLTR